MVFERALESDAGSGNTAPGPSSPAASRRLPSSVPSSLSGRVVVVSPHVDDAVFSLAGTLARAARSGAEVEVLNDLCPRPAASEEPANGWDTRAGFTTEGEAARARRDEDREACRLVGAEPTWVAVSGWRLHEGTRPRCDLGGGDGSARSRKTALSCQASRCDQPRSRLDLRPVHDATFERPSSASMPNSRYRYMVRRERPEPEPPPRSSTSERQSHGRARGQVLPATASQRQAIEDVHRSCLCSVSPPGSTGIWI